MSEHALSFTGKRWNIADTDFLNASHVLALLSRTRNIDLHAEGELTPPSAFDDMQRTVDRIHYALENDERIGIFGDYDCDGVTAAAQLIRYCRRHGHEPWVRLPHRIRDGYGLHAGIVEEIQGANVDLLITVDTGIASVKHVATLQSAGIDTIVTDHHQCRDTLPPAYAIVHPERSSCSEPYFAGSGVAYQLVSALEDGSWEGQDDDLILATFGTIADLVPLLGDNRTLVQKGIRAFQNVTQGPLAVLRESLCGSQAPTTSDIAFGIAPRINAAGRVGDPQTALMALLEGEPALNELTALNEERKELTALHMDTALSEIPSDTPPLLCVCSEDFPHGILGLIAGRLTEQFGRPSLVGVIQGDMCTASLRSPACYDITAGLARCSSHLTEFGGHAQAAGVVFPTKNFTALQESLSSDVLSHTEGEDLLPTLHVDGVLDPHHISEKFCADLSTLEPFGSGNPEPRFLLKNVTLNQPRTVGSDDTHLQGSIGGIKTIGFGLGPYAHHAETPLDIVGRVSLNTWKGKRQPQIIMEDIGMAESVVATEAQKSI